jgi:hypothetical protein
MNTDHFDDTFPLQSYNEWDPFDLLELPDTNTVHAADSPPIPASTEPDENTLGSVAEDTPSETPPRGQESPQPSKLGLVQLNKWNEEKTYDEDPPSCIHYSIEWSHSE